MVAQVKVLARVDVLSMLASVAVSARTVAVTVLNSVLAEVPDGSPPSITSSSSQSVAENAHLSHTLTASETVTWSIVGGADQLKFELSGSTLRWAGNGTKDYEAPDDAGHNNGYVVTVRAASVATSLTANQTITVTVTNVSEGPAELLDDGAGVVLTDNSDNGLTSE